MRFYLLILLSIFFKLSKEFAGEENGRTEVKVGAIFFKDEDDIELSFDESFREINNLKYFEIKFVTIKRYLAEDDSLKLQQLACELISSGVGAIFGPSSKASSDIVALIANTTGIPHIEFDSKIGDASQLQNHLMSVNIAPSLQLISTALLDIVRDDFEWKTFTVIYETDEGLARVQDVLQIRTVSMDTIKLRKLSDYEADYRVLWKEAVETFHETHLILDCNPDLLGHLIQLAQSFELFGPFRSWFFTHLDTHSSRLRSMYDATFRANMTAVRLKTLDLNPYERRKVRLTRYDELLLNQTMQPTLMHDAVILYANAARKIITALGGYEEPQKRCEVMGYRESYPWFIGEQIVKEMKTLSEDDIEPALRTENLGFNEFGQRIQFNLEIYKPTLNEPLALWKPNDKIVPLRARVSVDNVAAAAPDFSLQRKMYKVATHYEDPYFMLKPDHAELRGPEKYEGYAVDLIRKLSEILDFDYDFAIEKGNGKYDHEKKKWDGIIGKLIDHQAQIGVADITITQSRREVVDFTVPFMQLGIAILHFKKPLEPKDPFAFLNPFSPEVWLSMMLAMLIMTILFTFIARISYVEYRNPRMTLPDSKEVTNKWHTQNSAWLMVGSIMQQGCDILPRGPPMRILSGIWWFFAMMMVSTYTASLAAFLTSNKMQSDIKCLKDLIEQSEVRFGTLSGGSTSLFFSESNHSDYFRAWNKMKTFKPSTLTKSNKEGVERVRTAQGDYAYLMETTSILYNTERFCDLTQVGPQIGEKHYALAVPLGAPYRTNLSVSILELGEKGELYKMKSKWWKNQNGSCNAQQQALDGEELSIIEIGGVFVVLGVGVFIGIIIGLIEFIWNVRSVAVREKVTPWVALKAELNFAWRLWLKRKPRCITAGLRSKSHSTSRRSSRQSRAQSHVSKASSKTSSKSKTKST